MPESGRQNLALYLANPVILSKKVSCPHTFLCKTNPIYSCPYELIPCVLQLLCQIYVFVITQKQTQFKPNQSQFKPNFLCPAVVHKIVYNTVSKYDTTKSGGVFV
jgi:hypothetical protein